MPGALVQLEGTKQWLPTLGKDARKRTPGEWEKIYTWLDKHEGEANYLKRAVAKWPGCSAPALKYRWKNRLSRQGTPGPEPRLTEEGEKAFKEWLEMQQDVGNCVYTEELGKEAARWGKRLGIDSGVGGRKWVKGFFKRNPGLAARQSQLVETCRLTGMNPPAVLRFFDIAGYALGVNDPPYEVPPERVYMMDEVGVQACHLKRKHMVVARRGPQPVYKPASNVESHITLVGCVSASGKVLCPTLVYQGERCRKEWHATWIEAKAAANTSGYMTKELFVEWASWFVEASGAVSDGQRRVLFLDNHQSHLSHEAREILKKYNVQVVAMHPHTTHVFCVLDVAIFATFKRKLYKIFKKKSEPGVPVSKDTLTGWMRWAYRKATKDRVDKSTGETFNPCVRGFAKVGLVPFKPKLATDVVFAHHREWIKQKQHAMVEAEGVAVEEGAGIYALSHEERVAMIEGLKKDGALAIKLAKEAQQDPSKRFKRRAREVSDLLTSDERMEKDFAKEAEKAAEAERLESVRRKRAEDKAARGGLSTVEWNKQEAAKKREAKLAAKAAAEAAAAAEKAARAAEEAAMQQKAKKARVEGKPAKVRVPVVVEEANVYRKEYSAAGRRGGKRARD